MPSIPTAAPAPPSPPAPSPTTQALTDDDPSLLVNINRLLGDRSIPVLPLSPPSSVPATTPSDTSSHRPAATTTGNGHEDVDDAPTIPVGPPTPTVADVVDSVADTYSGLQHRNATCAHAAVAMSVSSPAAIRMIVAVTIAGIHAVAMVDTGANISAVGHRFLERHHRVAALQPTHSAGVDVTVADSRSYRSLSSVPCAPVRFTDGVTYKANLMTLPLPSGVDVLLGTDFLNSHKATIQFSGAAAATISLDGHAAVTTTSNSSRHSHAHSGSAPSVHYVGAAADGTAITIELGSDAPVRRRARKGQHQDQPVLVLSAQSAVGQTDAAQAAAVDNIVDAFPAVFNEPTGLPDRPGMTPMRIPLKPGAQLPAPRSYRIPHRQLAVLNEWVAKALAKGWIVAKMSPVSEPIFLVPKKEPGTYRIVQDFRRINAITASVAQSATRSIEGMHDRLVSAKWISCADLTDGFYQLRLDDRDAYLTGFTVGGVAYQWRVASMGLTYSPLHFQREVDRVLRADGLLDEIRLASVLPFMDAPTRRRWTQPHAVDDDTVPLGADGVPRPDLIIGALSPYVDDLCASTDFEDPGLHHALLRAMFTCLEKANVFLKRRKCQFMCRAVTFLGFEVGAGKLSPDADKIAVLRDWPAPTTVPALRRFLGYCGYFRRHLPGFSDLARPLHALTVKSAPYTWGPDQQRSFDALLAALQRRPCLQLPKYDRPFIVVSDASATGVGAALMQQHGDHLLPCAYFSRSLTDSERNYDARELECYGVLLAFEKWRHHLWGYASECRVLTDHKSLEYLRTQKEISGRIARWCLRLSEYNFQVSYYPGRANVIADALSRRPHSSQIPAVLEHLSTRVPDICDVQLPVPAAMLTAQQWSAYEALVLTRSATARPAQTTTTASPAPPPTSSPTSPPRPAATAAASGDSPATAAPDPVDKPESSGVDAPFTRVAVPTELEFRRLYQYAQDKDFGPIVELLELVQNNPELRRLRREQPAQLDPKLVPSHLRRHIPKLNYYQYSDGILYNLGADGRTIVVPDVPYGDTTLRRRLLELYHDDPLSGHRGADRTYRRLRRSHYWHKMSRDVKHWVTTCGECARAKARTTAPTGLVNPLPVGSGPFHHISMDWIMPLDPCRGTGHDAILVVICDFSKRVRLIPCCTTITGRETAELMRRFVFLQYGFPVSVRSDRDPRLTGKFWTDFVKYTGIVHKMTSGGYAASNGLVERMNRVIEEIARCYVDFRQYRLWEILDELEFSINDSVNPETNVSPFQATLGYSPLRPIEISSGAYRASAVASLTEHYDRICALQSQVRDGLVAAQAAWVYEANQHRRAVPLDAFQPGDWVYVDSRNFTPAVDRDAAAHKLQHKFEGPYEIQARVSPTSYRVKLPPRRRVHNVFHSTRMKLATHSALYPDRRGGRADPLLVGDEEHWEVETILRSRMHRRRQQYLVHWQGFPVSESTWESATDLKADGCQDSIDDFEHRPVVNMGWINHLRP